MSDDRFRRKIKKYISARDWKKISGEWIGYLPTLESPKTPPDPVLDDFHLLTDILKSNSGNETFQQEVDGLRQLLFHEGLFLFHKAVNVISASEIHVREGILTWSLSSAYHGAFFGAKAIMRFLGVATAVDNRNHWIVDTYPELPRLTSRDRKRGLKPAPSTSFTCSHTRIEHRHIWIIFQRLMRVSRFQDTVLDHLGGILSKYFDERDFSRQRNALHYRNDTWFFDDLYQFLSDPAFGARDILSLTKLRFETEESDFTMILAFAILFFGISLLESLSEKTHKLDDALNLVKESITPERHPIYASMRSIPSCPE